MLGRDSLGNIEKCKDVRVADKGREVRVRRYR